MTAVAIIPARGGSRRIPRKNIKLFHDFPMISYPIAAAKESGLFDAIYVSTEDAEVGKIADRYGAIELTRPQELARDEIGTQEVMRSELGYLVAQSVGKSEIEYACCIYPCTPMMTAVDLQRSTAWLQMSDGQGYAHIPGWFYFAKTATFLAGVPVEFSAPMSMSNTRYIDINTPADWLRAELMYEALHREKA